MRSRVFVLVAVALCVPVFAAHAQDTNNTNANNANTNANATSTATTTTTAGDTASATASVRPMAGYGYSDPKPSPRHFQVRSGTRHHANVPAFSGPVATLPGFGMLPEGGSRLFVELTQAVQVEEHRARGTITYVLKGAHVLVHNNTNPLVTVHFNTPVADARLAQAGNDLHFVIVLRADATPSWKMNPGKEGSSVLTVDFPKGSYVTPQ